MCKWGTTRTITIYSGGHSKKIEVDACIIQLVQALNDAGIETVASCCGHGNSPGSIVLRDGRELIVTSFETARWLDKFFPDIWGKWR